MRHEKGGEYMKKVLAILVSLLFSFSVTAFAQETAPTTDTGTPQIEQQSKAVKAKKTVKKAKKKKAKKAKKSKKSKKTKEAEQENPQ
jgi:uncharacterized protein YxeA